MSTTESDHYRVSVALDATWATNIFTYRSNTALKQGDIVVVPFGKTQKLGVVLDRSNDKPKNIKQITRTFDLQLSRASVKQLAWLNTAYPAMPGVHTQHFLPSFIAHQPGRPTTVSTQPAKKKHPALTTTQKQTIETLTNSTQRTNILHGITGSGKTRVYIELAKKQLQAGKNVLILYPEISLTSQLEAELRQHFSASTLNTFHSRQTPTERRSAWQHVHNIPSQSITIGPRSALFLPHQNLGLIIIDEAHDSAYKQDSDSRYNGLQVAAALARHHDASLLLGSATPPVQETQHITTKNGALVCMHELAKTTHDQQRHISIVDMTDARNRNQTAPYVISKPLRKAIQAALDNKKQTLLFLNRRGTARMLLCENCGWHSSCSRCDNPMTYHHNTHQLRCHICGNSQKTPITCPDCGHTLSLKTPGTKAIEQELTKLFPDVRVARFDSDNKKADSFSEQYETVRSGKYDILIGTQLLTKGLDLPKLAVVGVLQADSSLFLPDFASEERTFQQLMQVSGRVGRGHANGTVLVQTYQPANPLFQYVTAQDWHGYYAHELERRKVSHYPPFSFSMKLWTAKKTEQAASAAMRKLERSLSSDSQLRLLGPAPGFHQKVGGKYFWQIIVFSPSRKRLSTIAASLPKAVVYDLDPISFI